MKVGERYQSPSTAAQIIVMRAPAQDVEVTLAGELVVPLDPTAAPSGTPVPDSDEQLQVGKRYVDDESGLEVLCTTAGAGPLVVDGRSLTTAAAKLLPSSD
jgi:hypothetical protein